MSEILNIEDSFRGIDLAFEHIELINKLRQVIAKHDPIQLSNESIAIIKLTSNNILSNLRLNNKITRTSMENLTTSTEINISFEGLVDTIWEAIKKTFKALWDMITYLFRSQHRDLNKAQDNVKQTPKQIETIKDNLQSGKQELPVDEYLDTRKPGMRELLRNFSYLGDDPELTTILLAMEKVTINNLLIADLVESLEIMAINLIIYLGTIIEDIDDQSVYDEYEMEIFDIYTNELARFVNKTINLSTSQLPNMDRRSYRNLRELNGFINDSKVYFYNPPDDNNNQVLVQLSLNLKSDYASNKIKAFTIDALDNLHDHDKYMTLGYVKVNEGARKRLLEIEDHSNSFLNTFDLMMKHPNSTMQAKINNNIGIVSVQKERIKDVLKTIVAITAKFTGMVDLQCQTVLAYNHLVKMNVEHYQKH